MKFLMTILILMGCLSLYGQVVTVDFTTMDDANTFGTLSQASIEVEENGQMVTKYMMWAGDVDGDGITTYDGDTDPESGELIDPDAAILLSIVLSNSGNFFNSRTFIFQDYSSADLNLDGFVTFDGDEFEGVPIEPDAAYLLDLVLNSPDNFFNSRTFRWKQELPLPSN